MARRVDAQPPETGQLSTVTAEQERRLRQMFRDLDISSRQLREFEQEGGE